MSSEGQQPKQQGSGEFPEGEDDSAGPTTTALSSLSVATHQPPDRPPIMPPASSEAPPPAAPPPPSVDPTPPPPSNTTTTTTTTSTGSLTPRLGSRKSYYSSTLRSPVLTSSLSATNLADRNALDSPRISVSRQPSPSSSTVSSSVAPSPMASNGAPVSDSIPSLLASNSSSTLFSQRTTTTTTRQQQQQQPCPPQQPLDRHGQQQLLSSRKNHYRSARHRPKPATKCPLLCCYYAEFDNQVGPKVCSQTPPGFMDRYAMDTPLAEMEAILDATLTALLRRESADDNEGEEKPDNKGGTSDDRIVENENPEMGSSLPPLSASSPQTSATDDASIFASCSDFIITGSELTGSILNLSTHQIHVVSRPTLLSHERYERNALLFSVGFVLRRTEDPRPFRAVLNHLSTALADAEHETQFLSRPSATRHHVLRVLEQLLLDLNSPSWECHLHLDVANVVNLKLFHPPKAPAKPVPDYAVPILLRRDRHVQLYDWDLAINWVSLHVDGILNSRQIAKVAEVDLDMVLQCLRVLRHHSVIALVDMFFFTNRYEGTDKAAEMLAGRHPDLLLAAVQFCTKGGGTSPNHDAGRGGAGHGTGSSRSISHSGGGTDWSPSLLSNNSDPHFHPRGGAGAGGGGGTHSAPDMASSPGGIGGGSASYEDRHTGGGYFHVSPRYHRGSLDSNAAIAGLSSSPGAARPPLLRPEEEVEMKTALAELYCTCHAGASIGDVWVELLASPSRGTGTTSKRWRRAFQKIDHRRFASFGLVHGLLRRMHCYPMVLHSTLDEEERDLLSTSAPEPEYSASAHVPTLARERSARSTSAGSQIRPPSSTQAARQPDRRTILRVAHLMDGTRCDDEIVSLIGQPLEKLLEMVADRSVTCTYAPGSHY